MKKFMNILCGFALYIVCAILFMGYGHTETHPFLNDVIVLKFLEKASTNAFTDTDKFKKYQFTWNSTEAPELTGPAIPDGTDFYLSYSSADEVDKSYTPAEWINKGGWMEDEPWGPASLCHFYDPVGIDNGKKWLTDASGYLETGLTPLIRYNTRDALSWALNDPDHLYTWTKGKNYIIQALREADPEKRKRYMALAYRSLGQVMHLLCDMGCTPHVRNDSHPPYFWVIMGDPDPYEDICKKLDVYSLWQINPVNENFKNEIASVKKFDVIFDKMARFTNEKFFSGQTINTDRVPPVIRAGNPYPSPLVTEADYNKKEYTYYKNYDGVKVKMCKDKVPIPYSFILGNDSVRGRPYLDYDCVKSIASALFPNIAEAGAQVIKLFIPSLKIEITEAKTDSGGIVRGKVAYTIPSLEDEYSGLFDLGNTYNGPVSLFINNADTKITAAAKQNNFEFKLENKISTFKKDASAVAKFEFGGIIVQSDLKKVSSNAPVILSVTPSKGKTSDEISISGNYFGTDKTKGQVIFQGATAASEEITYWTSGVIKVKVPQLAVSGEIKIKVNEETSNGYYFGIPPVITSLSKNSGKPGDLITINGTKFGNLRSEGSVKFNGTPAAEINNWSDQRIDLRVPAGASTGDVIVTVKGEESNKVKFEIGGIQITSIVPNIGLPGDTISINGSGFGTDKTKGVVAFVATGGTVIANTILSWADTKIIAIVPLGAQTGTLKVRVNSDWSNELSFSVDNRPIIYKVVFARDPYDRKWVLPEQVIRIIGVNFLESSERGKIYINGTIEAQIINWGPTWLECYPPKDLTGDITLSVVTKDGQQSNSGSIFIGIPYEVLKTQTKLDILISLGAKFHSADNVEHAYPFLGISTTANGPVSWGANGFTADVKDFISYKTGTVKVTVSDDGLKLKSVELTCINTTYVPYENIVYKAENIDYSVDSWSRLSFSDAVVNITTDFSGTLKYDGEHTANIEGVAANSINNFKIYFSGLNVYDYKQ